MAGAFFENLIVTEALKYKWNQGINAELYYFRDSNKNEIDLVLDMGRERRLAEIKMGKTTRVEDVVAFQRTGKTLGASKSFWISLGEAKGELARGVQAVPWTQLGLIWGVHPSAH
jgi:predicted AAA+ superfamily ATPase